MRRLASVCFFVILLFVVPASAQAPSYDATTYGIYAFRGAGEFDLMRRSRPASRSEMKFVNEVMEATSLPQTFEVRVVESAQVNAVALTHQGRRVILVSSSFLEAAAATGEDWAAFGVLAHEISHHLAGHTIGTDGSTHETELEADRRAGHMMALMGASEPAARAAVEHFAEGGQPSTHPPKEERIAEVMKGWQQAMRTSEIAVKAGKCRALLDAMNYHESWWMEKRADCQSLKKFHGWIEVPTDQGVEVTQRFLDLEMDPNAADSDGNTALHHLFSAFECGMQERKLDLLMGKGANPLLTNNSGQSPIGLAWNKCCYADSYFDCDTNRRLARSMTNRVNASGEVFTYWKFFEAAKNGTVQDFIYYLVIGYEVDTADDEGNTALHHAALGCNLDLIEHLIDARDRFGYDRYAGWLAAASMPNRSGQKPHQILESRCPGVFELVQIIESQSH